MPRIRTIKPEFWDSPSTARASLRARLFFISMWNWADDYGRGTANAKALIGFAFPNDDEVTAADYPSLASEVSECFGVMFYEVDGRPYFAIPTFDKHQRTEKKAKPSFPEPPAEPQQTSGVGSSVVIDGPSDASDGDTVLGTGEQGNRGTGEQSRKKPSASPRVSEQFNEFWMAYPRKVAKGDAEKAWAKAVKIHPADQIIAAAVRYSNQKADPQFIPYPATWLNRRHWEDELSTQQARFTQTGTATDEGWPW